MYLGRTKEYKRWHFICSNILLPFGAGVSAHVYAFFENERKSKYSTDQHALVAVS